MEKNLQQIIDVISGAVKTGIDQLADGFQYTDIFAFVPVLSQIPEAIKDADSAWHYLKDMSEEKEAELVNAIVAKLGDNAHTREAARRMIKAATEVYMLYMFFANNGGATAAPGK